ncbi:MAG: SO_0444 family Cu/Zn efflux transporter [Bacteroidales bacterium]|nr:SO_0444 family Cu/Zn efflux transporter [Bacteroidales bacterium]
MNEIIHLVTEMTPFLLLGFLIAGILHAFMPKDFFKKYLSKKGLRSVLNAALLGIPLPLCSCGVIPTAMSLHREGASKGATVSFLIATPQTGVDSIAATYSLMGLPFAIIRPIAAMITALFGGIVTDLMTNDTSDECESDDHCCCHEHHDEHEEDDHCCCHKHHEEHEEHDHCCCHEHQDEHEEGCHCHHEEVKADATFGEKMKAAIHYAFIDMMEDIGKWLFIGLLIAGVITVFIPDSFFDMFVDNSLLSMLLVLAVSVPMYVCATGSIPIAAALLMKGLTPGSALVMLMAGPACNMASIIVLGRKMGRRSLVTYILSIVVGSVLCGLLMDWMLPREWFQMGLKGGLVECCEPSWWEWLSTIVFFGLMFYVFVVRRFMKKGGHCHE